MDPLGKGLGRGFKGSGGPKPYLNPQKYVKLMALMARIMGFRASILHTFEV